MVANRHTGLKVHLIHFLFAEGRAWGTVIASSVTKQLWIQYDSIQCSLFEGGVLTFCVPG